MRIPGELCSWNQRLKPQKVRPEDGGERRKTSNHPMRIPAELSSWNRSLEPNLLLLHVDRSSYSSYFPQKVRPEDGRERQKTSNCPMRIPAELRSWNRSLKPNLLVDRNRRLCDGGWEQMRTSSRRRNSRSHRNRGERRNFSNL